VGGARTPTVASDSAAAAASAAGRFNVQQTSSNPYFLFTWSFAHTSAQSVSHSGFVRSIDKTTKHCGRDS
jgi:hypothetical protein